MPHGGNKIMHTNWPSRIPRASLRRTLRAKTTVDSAFVSTLPIGRLSKKFGALCYSLSNSMATVAGDLGRQAESLVEIQLERKLRLSYVRWMECFKLMLTSIEGKRARAGAAKNEMYLMLSFYLVFQGAVMNMLSSKANSLQCTRASFPAALSTVALVAILAAVHDKFHEYHIMKKKLERDESEAKTLVEAITGMLNNGAKFDFAMAGSIVGVGTTSPEAAEAAKASPEAATASAETATASPEAATASPEAATASAETATASPEAGTASPEAATASLKADYKWFNHEPHYYDVMGFLITVYCLVVSNCFYVC